MAGEASVGQQGAEQGDPQWSAAARQILAPVRDRLMQAQEHERYRLLATLLTELAASQSNENGKSAPTAEQVATLTKKLQTLGEAKASLDDEISGLRADLSHKSKQLEAEQERATGMQKRLDEHRVRTEAAQKRVEELEAELTARNAALHRAENIAEDFQLKQQRAEMAAQDRSRTDALEQERQTLTVELEKYRKQAEQIRVEKDEQIEAFKKQLGDVQSQSGQGAESLLATLWERLARSKPPLAEGHIKPTSQAAERLFDACVELAIAAHGFESHMTPFLDRYTKHHDTLKRPWQAYRAHDDLLETARKTFAVTGGKPVGVLKMRLWGLKTWTMAALLASDTVVESIAAELEGHLRGPLGMGADPNFKIRDYIKNAGPDHFRDHMLKRRGEMLAEAYKLGS